ncbi:hypothetical protein ACG3M1_09035 [Clostridium sp. C45]|jgi:hypothetical protein|uniref:DUF7768 domain-containing protein n=1 Tax=Clostridium sp. 10cd* TaxID=3373596 RepID=UPI0037BFFD0C
MARPLAYITSVWSEEPHEAKEEALRFSRQVYEAGYSPICPMLMYAGLLKDNIPTEYKDKQEMSLELLRRSRILVVCGTAIDEPVKTDIVMAKKYHIAATTLEGILTVDGKSKKKE